MNKNISGLLEWCQLDIDLLEQLPYDKRIGLGEDQRRGWKRRLEYYLEHEDELQGRSFTAEPKPQAPSR